MNNIIKILLLIILGWNVIDFVKWDKKYPKKKNSLGKNIRKWYFYTGN